MSQSTINQAPTSKDNVGANSTNDYNRMKSLLDTADTRGGSSSTALGSALSTAAVKGSLPIVQLLLSHGAPISMTANALVTREGKPNTLAILQAFLAHGWDINSAATPDGYTTLSLMLFRRDSEEITSWFLANGANANSANADGMTLVRRAAWGAPSAAVLKLLLSHGATVKNTSALHQAAFRDEDDVALDMLKLLLDSGAEIDELEFQVFTNIPLDDSYRDRGTALHIAAEKGHVDRAKLLIELGADLGKRSESGYTAKDWAQINRQEEVKGYLEGEMRRRGMGVEDIEVSEHYWDEEGSPFTRIP